MNHLRSWEKLFAKYAMRIEIFALESLPLSELVNLVCHGQILFLKKTILLTS